MKLYTKLRCVKVRGNEEDCFTAGREYPLGMIMLYDAVGIADNTGEALYVEAMSNQTAIIPGFQSLFELVP